MFLFIYSIFRCTECTLRCTECTVQHNLVLKIKPNICSRQETRSSINNVYTIHSEPSGSGGEKVLFFVKYNLSLTPVSLVTVCDHLLINTCLMCICNNFNRGSRSRSRSICFNCNKQAARNSSIFN